jgi:hypothetical protein
MQLTDVGRLQQALQEARTTIPGVEAAAVVSAEGLTIASALPPQYDEERLVAVAAAMLDVGQRTRSELELGQLEQVYVRSANGYVVIIPAGNDAVLAVILGKDAKLGLVFLNLRRFADQVAQALGSV